MHDIIIGDRIKELRLARNLTQRQFASFIKVADHTVTQYESGAAFPSLVAVMRIAMAFNVRTDYILGLEDEYGVRREYGAAKQKSRHKQVSEKT
jgi:transcriptional regulator with XRE-family HTH domain